VTTVHGPYTVGKYSSVMVRGDKIIAVSNMIRQYILNNYSFVHPSSIEVIHRGVDTSVYRPEFRPDEEWKSNFFEEFPQMKGKVLLTIPARLTRWKGQEDFIEIMKVLVQETQSVHGVIVGSAHSRKQEFAKRLQHAITSLGLEEHITMIGHRNDLKEILSLSKVVFSLSREPEAFGRTTIEALSLGTPVIAYNHGGVSEQLETLLPEGSIHVGQVGEAVSILQKWLSMLPTPLANSSFTLASMCSKTIDIYTELCSNEK